MLHKGMRVAYAIVLIASAIVSFMVLRNFDETTTRGADYAITFGKSDNGASAERVTTAVEDFATGRHVNIGRLYYDSLDVNRRLLYLAVGDADAESTTWLKDGYPYFSREAQLQVRPYRQVAALSPDGEYFVYGTSADAVGLLRTFRDLGYEGSLHQTRSLNTVVQFFDGGALTTFFLIVGLVAVVGVSSSVALNAKSYGVQRLHGRSLLDLVWRDMVQQRVFMPVALIAALSTAGGFLLWYNGLHQIDTYGTLFVMFFGIYTIAGLGAYLTALAFLQRSSILDAVKGEITAAWAIVGSYVLRGWGLLLILSISASLMTSAINLRDQRHIHQAWASIGNAYYIRINGAIEYLKVGRDVDERIGRWIRDADMHDKVSLASYQSLSGPVTNILVVNNRYLAKHEILDSNGISIKPKDAGSIQILVPRRYSDVKSTVGAEVMRWALSQNKDASKVPPRDLLVEEIRDGQSVVSYSRSMGVTDLKLKDQIVVVVGGGSALISNDEYVSIASRGEVLVENPDAAMKSLTSAGLDDYILGMSPFAEDAAVNYRDAARELSMQIINLVVGIAVLIITGLAVAVVYCRRNAQVLFVKYIHGWSFGRMHWKILALEISFGLVTVWWVRHNTAAALSDRQMLIPPSEVALMGWKPALAGAVMLVSLAFMSIILVRTTARFVKTHSATLS